MSAGSTGNNPWGPAGTVIAKDLPAIPKLPSSVQDVVDAVKGAFDYKDNMDRGYQFTRNSFPSTAVQSSNAGTTNLEDPTYLGFSLLFGGPLFTMEDSPLSAFGYLNRRDPTRAATLATFLKGWQNIVHRRPWYFQTIAGLSEAWSGSFMGKDPYIGSGSGEGITVGCLEAIDLKMTALFNLYRQALWDMPYRREIIPENLRHFSVMVRVMEIRNFDKSAKGLLGMAQEAALKAAKGAAADALGIGPLDQTAWEFWKENKSEIRMTFDECEFSPDSGIKVFDTVNNAEGSLASTEFKFKYGNFTMENDYAGLPAQLDSEFRSVSDADRGGTDDDVGEMAKKMALTKLNDIAAGLMDDGAGKMAALAQGLKLGNVFGTRAKLAAYLNSPESAINDALGAGVQAIGRAVAKGAPNLADNIFGLSATEIARNLGGGAALGSLGAIFEPAPEPPTINPSDIMGTVPYSSPENPGNIFGQPPPGPNPDIDGNIFE